MVQLLSFKQRSHCRGWLCLAGPREQGWTKDLISSEMLCLLFVPGLGTCAGMEPVVLSPRAEGAELSQAPGRGHSSALPLQELGLSTAKTGA